MEIKRGTVSYKRSLDGKHYKKTVINGEIFKVIKEGYKTFVTNFNSEMREINKDDIEPVLIFIDDIQLGSCEIDFLIKNNVRVGSKINFYEKNGKVRFPKERQCNREGAGSEPVFENGFYSLNHRKGYNCCLGYII